jgi:acetyl-CoA C-acetyltransferase/3-oxo-5,6-didehydrosuberyl-CoA/3-oxoadipyl-CoA thiolase
MGKLGGQLAFVRPDDLAAHAVTRLLTRNPDLDPMAIEDVQWGAANQAGEDNRNLARMTALLAGLPIEIPGATVNRLCGSGMQAVVSAAHALQGGWGEVMIAGGSESMSRAPYVTLKPETAFPTGAPQMVDTVLGWRLVNPRMEQLYPPISLGMTAEVVAEKYDVTREDQDRFALTSHEKALKAGAAGRFGDEIEPIEAPLDARRRQTRLIDTDEGPRPDTSLETLAGLPAVFKEGGTVTAGNSSPMNDGAAALLLATKEGLTRHGLTPMARIVSTAAAGLRLSEPRLYPAPRARRGAGQSEWGGHRHRPPPGRFRGPDPGDADTRAETTPRPLWACHHVHRGRPGDLYGHRECLRAPSMGPWWSSWATSSPPPTPPCC